MTARNAGLAETAPSERPCTRRVTTSSAPWRRGELANRSLLSTGRVMLGRTCRSFPSTAQRPSAPTASTPRRHACGGDHLGRRQQRATVRDALLRSARPWPGRGSLFVSEVPHRRVLHRVDAVVTHAGTTLAGVKGSES